ncbi:MAG: hypothetical protein ACR652_24405 [Methylocystis sp.]|uniref:hypothetical protein n=1 Tax=Methylocystis sp. TaxID=1911079 RepID=UPI003DA1F1C5
MNREQMLASPTYVKCGFGTNTAVTLTIAAPTKNGSTNYLQSIMYSATAAPTLTSRVTIAGPQTDPTNGTLGVVAQTLGFQVPASAFAPVVRDWGTHPVYITPGVDLVVILPAFGAGVVGEVVVGYSVGSA